MRWLKESARKRGEKSMAARLAKKLIHVEPEIMIPLALSKRELVRAMGQWIPKWDQLPTGFDLERLRGLVFDPMLRRNAFAILGRTKLVSPGDVGLGWLLALAKRADPAKLSARAKRDLRLKPEIERVFVENFEVYGVRKVWRLEWVHWFNHQRLFEPIGNVPPAEAEARYYAQLEAPAMAA